MIKSIPITYLLLIVLISITSCQVSRHRNVEIRTSILGDPVKWTTLSEQEKINYLTNRRNYDDEMVEAILDNRILIGMHTGQVSLSIGRPNTINKSTTSHGTSQQWVYRKESRFPPGSFVGYVYFRDGNVRSYQTR